MRCCRDIVPGAHQAVVVARDGTVVDESAGEVVADEARTAGDEGVVELEQCVGVCEVVCHEAYLSLRSLRGRESECGGSMFEGEIEFGAFACPIADIGHRTAGISKSAYRGPANRGQIRILWVAQHLYPDTKGGGQYHGHAMLSDQAAMGHEVTVVTTRVDDSLPGVRRHTGTPCCGSIRESS
jgi:hypothetical protein